jgi:hypothetical protein
MSAFYNAFALVGCGWNNGSAGGLWCWNFTEHSSAYGVVGARLIILRYSLWDLMCFVLVFFLFAYTFALVGGRYDNGLPAGLWYWNCWENSGSANANIGARLIIFKIHIKGFGVLARS